jgi:hypothetical protein
MRRIALFSALTLAALTVGALPAAAHGSAAGPVQEHVNARGGLDCNGFSPLQKTFAHLMCTEIASNSEYGFEDNGHYVGHDEPDLGFFSHKPGSGNSMSYQMVLPKDPAAPASGKFSGPVHYFQLSPALWFGLTMCDNQSYPEGTKICRPDSDKNIEVPPRPDHAGAAFTELQFYPPGYGPFNKGKISCDQRHWCAAFTIDSLQAEFGALHGPGSPPHAIANNNCPEPVNFAFLTRNGRPVGPPGPDQQTNATFTPTPNVLKMNPGDVVKVKMFETPAGYRTVMIDRTTHQRGFMTASVANGFRHILWDPKNLTCNGAPYAFHAMYNTASAPLANGQPTAWTTWAAHTDNVAYDVETGHFEKPDSASDLNPNEDIPCFKGPVIPGCLGSDSDFDGFPYHADWPNGSAAFPTPNLISSPHVLNGAGAQVGSYPVARFETDLPRIEEANNGGGLHCNHHTGRGCTNPPPGAFYPWYHLLRVHHKLAGQLCAWGLSNNIPGQISNFGGEKAAWGPLELTNYGFDLRYHNFAHVIGNPCP